VCYNAGKVSKLTVISTNAGAGTLAVHIEGPSKLAIVCTELDDGYEFTYTPMMPGNYMIIIKYCSVTIAGCPFKATVTGTGLCAYTVSQQNDIDVARYNSNARQPILAIFGRDAAERVGLLCHRMMICYVSALPRET